MNCLRPYLDQGFVEVFVDKKENIRNFPSLILVFPYIFNHKSLGSNTTSMFPSEKKKVFRSDFSYVSREPNRKTTNKPNT